MSIVIERTDSWQALPDILMKCAEWREELSFNNEDDSFEEDKFFQNFFCAWIAKENGSSIGCIVLNRSGEIWELDGLAVIPSARGRLIGKRLIKELLKWVDGNRILKIYCATQLRKSFIAWAGFREISFGELPEVINHCADCKSRGQSCFPRAYLRQS